MKLTLLLCLAAALTGWSQKKGDLTKKQGTDSPIIVSDSSTHFKHPHAHLTGQVARVSDTGFHVTYLDCTNCTLAAPVNLIQGWTLDAYGKAGGGPRTLVLTAGSTDNVTVTADFHANTVHDAGGGNITHDTLTLDSARITNPGGAGRGTYTCTASPCQFQIHYFHP